MSDRDRIAIIGAGLAGCSVAARLANAGVPVDLYDKNDHPISGASLHGEGKLHLGYVYSADPTGDSWRVMTGAALSFADMVSETFDLPADSPAQSAPFLYAVPTTSELKPAEIEDHFRAVDAHIAACGAQLRPVRRLSDAELRSHFDPETIVAAYATPEIAIDSPKLGQAIRHHLAETGRVRFFGRHRVSRAVPGGADEFHLHIDGPAGPVQRRYDLVVNASWEDRLRLDRSVGILPPRPAITRYKASIIFPELPDELSARIPTVTFALGPYGDLVNRGRSGAYLSWYPVCKLGETTDVDTRVMLDRAIGSCPDGRIVEASIAGLAHFVPAVAELSEFSRHAQINGGAIVAWGQTDITDPISALHGRDNIGVVRTGNWISINTGKLTTAPLFAQQAVASILQAGPA